MIPEVWLAEGGVREDDGSPFSPKARFYRHFHNPLLSWNEAGLRTRYPFHLLPHQYTSSIRWMQSENQAADDGGAAGGEWSWQHARRLHYLVLTTDNAREREAKAAELFRALGQIMHLVVDASVPEHVRNDAHPFGTLSREVLRSRTAGNYEYWVSDQQARLGDTEFTRRYLSGPTGPDALITTNSAPTGESVARVPVALLLDTDRYRREAPDPNVTVSGPIGIAEFANANFFSEDTLPVTPDVKPEDRPFPYPRREDLIRRSDLAPFSQRVRAYLQKPAGHGLPTAFALAECRLEGRAAALPPYPCMDEAVWTETATHMLPRAVGYARGVLEYFFRGSVRVQTWRMRLGSAFIEIDNLTSEEMTGVFEVFGRPNVLASGEGRERTAVVNGGAPARIEPHGSVVLPIAYLQPQQPTPSQILVFRGRIGLEEDAVAAQVFTVAHAFIAQTAHTADLKMRCGITFDSPFRSRTETCNWGPTNMVTDGELITNRSATVIARVSLTPQIAGNQLVLDGVPVPAGLWQRQGHEPDPRGFSIRWSQLSILTVQLVDGTVVASRVYGSIAADGEAHKSYTDTPLGSDPPWYVNARRLARVTVSPHPSYRVLSISGYPNPTDIRADRFSVPKLVERVFVSDNNGDPRYLQRWTDHANVYWTLLRGLQESLKAEFEALSFGPVPTVPVEAVLERRYRPGELDFLRTFVTRDVLPSTLTVVGRRPSGT